MNKFLSEILEQPEALRNTLKYYAEEEGCARLEKIAKLWQSRKFSQIVFAGMGSSFFASQAAAYYLCGAGIKAFAANAGELLHYGSPVITDDTLLVCVSQSGESYEAVQILENLPENIFRLSISNAPKSSIIEKSHEHLLTKAGSEEMTSTKTYVSTLLVMLIFSYALSGRWNAKAKNELSLLISDVETIINERDKWLSRGADLLGAPSFVPVIGRGASYASALQTSLMFAEGARTPASGSLGGEFRHGPLEMVKKGFKAVAFAPTGRTYAQSARLISDIVKFGGNVIKITDSEEADINPEVLTIRIPCRGEDIFPIPAIVPAQLLVNELAERSGIIPGSFAHGAKVTLFE